MTTQPKSFLHQPFKRRGQSSGSMFALLVADALTDAEQPWTGLDLDGNKPDFSRSFPTKVKLFSVADSPGEKTLAVLKAAGGVMADRETRILDFPAEYLPVFRLAAQKTGWFDHIAQAGTKLAAIFFATSSEADARDIVESLTAIEGTDANLILVHNQALVGCETPSLFAPIERTILSRGGAKIILPELHPAVASSAQKLLGRALASSGAYPVPSKISSGLDFLEGALYEAWLSECRAALAGAADHLFPAPVAEAVRKKFTPKHASEAPRSTVAPDFD